MSPKTGRPKANNPKNIDVKVRFDKETHDQLMRYCDEHKVTRTEALRQGLKMLLDKK